MASCISINSPLIVIGGLTLTELVKYEVNYSKLWKDADRNMNGNVSATFIGVFPNIDVETPPIKKTQVAAICSALDQPYFTLTFWDPATSSLKTAGYYASDYKITLMNRLSGMYANVSFSVIPVAKRS